MRRLIIILAVAVVAVVLLLVLGATLLNVDHYRPRIQAELQKKLGRPVTLGELHLHLIPFSIKVDGLTIGEAAGTPSSNPFAKATEVFASASLMSLIRGNPEIKDLRLENPQIELIRNQAGVWNFSDLGKSGGQAPTSGPGGGLTLNQLRIDNGQVAITDLHTKSPRAVYNHIDLTIDGFAPGKQFDIDAELHFPGAGKELLNFKGKAGPVSTQAAQSTPVTGHLSLQQISLAGLNSISQGRIPPNTDAAISGDADVSSESGAVACKGTLKLENAVVRGAKVNYPIDARYDLKLNQTTDQITINSGHISLGPTAVAISGLLDSSKTPSNVNVRVQTTNASITELSRLGGLFGVAFDSDDQIKGSLTADITATGPLTAPQVHGTLSSTGIQAQDIALTNVHATCQMANGVVDLAPVSTGLFGGQANGTINLDTKAAHPLCKVKSKFSGVDTNALLSAVSSLKNTLYGSLAADADLSFAIDAGANVARTLNGTLGFNVANGHLKNVNILNELSRVGKFINSAPAQSAADTSLQKFSGTLNITNGVAATNNLVAVMNEGSLSANGTLNLVSQALDLHMNAVLSSGFSKAAGGTSVGGFLNTALANNKGELVLPVLVSGTTAHPVFTPDVQAIAKMKLNHLLPTVGDPSKLGAGGIGSVLGQALGGQQPSQKNNSQPANPVGSLLQRLGKKK